MWELVRAIKQASGKGDRRLLRVAEALGIEPARLRLAVDFYAVFPDEIDARISADERAASQVREMVQRRERLLSG